MGTGCPDWDMNHQVIWHYNDEANCVWSFPDDFLVTIDMQTVESGNDGFRLNQDPTFYTPPAVVPPLMGRGWINFTSDIDVNGTFIITATVACQADSDCPYSQPCYAPQGTFVNGVCQPVYTTDPCASTDSCRPHKTCQNGVCAGPIYFGASCPGGYCQPDASCRSAPCDPCVGGYCDSLLSFICDGQPLSGFSVSGSGCPAWDNNHHVDFFYQIFQNCVWTIPAGYVAEITILFIEPGFDFITLNYDGTHYDSGTIPPPAVVGPASIHFSSDVSNNGHFLLNAMPYP
jgi:hypothetical protein